MIINISLFSVSSRREIVFDKVENLAYSNTREYFIKKIILNIRDACAKPDFWQEDIKNYLKRIKLNEA